VSPAPAPTQPPPAWWGPALTPRERPAAQRPDWAEFVDDVLADAHWETAQGDWRAMLVSPFAPFAAEATRRAHAHADATVIDLAAVSACFIEQLNRRLHSLTTRTLVLELNRAAGSLEGATAEDRFADFVRKTSTPTGLSSLFTEYPVLARLIGQACLNAADAHLELLRRFAADRGQLTELGPLIGVTGGFGDAHQRGRSVKQLEFSGGAKVIYKPRPLELHAGFTTIVRWLNDRLPGLELETVDALVRPGYGWLRFVSHRPCESLTEVDRFYRRQGILLALLYALDGTDVHFENVVARGDQPVLIDIETLFHPTLQSSNEATDPASEALSRSVHRTSLLPQMFIGENGALDISGLGGGGGGKLPSDRVDWVDAGTDRMRLTRSPADLPAGVNRPKLGDRDIEPSEHSAALLAGFRLGYDAIVAGRRELLGLLNRSAGDVIRVLVRPTNFYAKLLDETTHPDLLRDAADRDEAFGLLWDDSDADPARQRLVDSELADLWSGDIPMFTGRPDSPDVWDSRGERFGEVLSSPSLLVVTNKIGAMNTVDQRDQAWLISAALATRPAEVSHRGGETLDVVASKTPDRAHVLAAASGVADQILARAFSDGGRANWVGLELVDERYWTVLPMGAGLGEGYCGVALFLAQLADLTGVGRYYELATRALRPVPTLIGKLEADCELAASAGCGGLLGLGGVAYALARLAKLLDEPSLLELVDRTLRVMPAAEPDMPAHFTTGLAGGVASMRSVFAQTGFDTAAKLADDYATQLTNADPLPGAGFAHGAAGVRWALGSDLPAQAMPEDHSWCSGLAGLTMAHADDPAGGLDDSVRRLAKHAPLRNMSLCHGEFGIVEVLSLLAERGHEGAATAMDQRTGRLLAAIDQRGPLCGTPGAVPSPGLLTGLSGIGYGLLRLGFRERVPSVLMLQPG
jgi:type 2 lantibiotic biosynthesis protein LanM